MHGDGDLVLADGLDRRVQHDLLRLMLTPSASNDAMMSRTVTDPNN